MAHEMAIVSPRVRADVVEASEFPQLVEKYRISGVPKIVINETVEFEGARKEELFLREVLRAAQN